MTQSPPTALVIGASGGLGAALTRGLLARSHVRSVIGTARRPEESDTLQSLVSSADGRLDAWSLDTTDDESLARFAEQLGNEATLPTLVIHAAGLLHDGDLQPEKQLADVGRAALERAFAVNAFGPLIVARAWLPLLPRRTSAKFVNLSAMVGSIGDNRMGGWFAYRASKAAANQFMKTLSRETRRTHPDLTLLSIHPGTTDTPLSAPFQARIPDGRLYSTEQSAERILGVIDANGPEQSGAFLNWDGETIPW